MKDTTLDARTLEKVREVLNDGRAAAYANARGGKYEATRGEGQAQAIALTLVLRELGLEDEHGNALTPPSSPTWPYVLRFAGQMEAMLDCNREKGDRAGWMKAGVAALLREAQRHTFQLGELVLSGTVDGGAYDHAAIARRAANVANFCMMVADRCGALVLPGESLESPSKSAPTTPVDDGRAPGCLDDSCGDCDMK